MPQSSVYRRRQIDNAKLRGERIVQKEILPVLQSRYKSLSRELREGNLRKRLRKDDGWFEKAKQNSWTSWFSLFDKTLVKALDDGAGFVWDTETKYFTAMNYPTFPFSGADVLGDYQARNGTQITNISKDTETRVNQAIADWYKTDQGLPELIGMLEQYFSATRAELIATTEMAYVASQVAYNMMDNYGIELWTWDAFMDAVTCDLCLALMEQSKKNPFTKNDPMPPDPSHPRCILPGNEVLIPDLVAAAKSYYVGRCIEITLANGRKLSVTENHPVLTPNGWVQAQFLRPFDNVIFALDGQRIANSINPNYQDRPTPIEEVFRSAMVSSLVPSRRVKVAPVDFHGDGRNIHGDVEIVDVDSFLRSDIQAASLQAFGKNQLDLGSRSKRGFVRQGAQNFFSNRHFPAFASNVGRQNLRGSLLVSHLTPLQRLGFGLSTAMDAVVSQDAPDNFPVNAMLDGGLQFRQSRNIVVNNRGLINRNPVHNIGVGFGANDNPGSGDSIPQVVISDTELARQFTQRFASLITCEQISKIRPFNYSGHVYDLQSANYGLYSTNGIITSNCRCGVYFLGVDVNVKKFLSVNIHGLTKGGAGSGNFGHSGREGIRGGSGGGGVGGGINPQVGLIPHYSPEKPVYEAQDASTLFDKTDRTVVVGIQGDANNKVYYCDSRVNHNEIVRTATNGEGTVDDYVRFRVNGKGRAEVSLYAAGVEYDTNNFEQSKAIDNVYDALDTLTSRGLPDTSKITLYDMSGHAGGVTITAEKLLKREKIEGE